MAIGRGDHDRIVREIVRPLAQCRALKVNPSPPRSMAWFDGPAQMGTLGPVGASVASRRSGVES